MSEENKTALVELKSPPITDPKPVKLTRLKEPDGRPQDAIPVAPVAPVGPVPRLVHDNERAPEGLKRFAIFCKSPLRPKRYVLARNRKEAEAHFRRYAGLAEQELVVKVMPD